VRVERNDALGSLSTVSVLPMLGAAVLHDVGSVTVKLRSAYGRGIRPATTPIRQTAWFEPHREMQLFNLAPEEQSGIEAGVDMFFGKTFGLQVTRFDQLASGLIQRVAYVESGSHVSGGPGPSRRSGSGHGRGPAPDRRRIAAAAARPASGPPARAARRAW